jgi:Uma2 family endonuclease
MATTPQRPRYPDEVKSMSDMALLEMLRRRFSVDEYNKMAEAGIFGADERVELLDGDLILAPSQGSPHFSVVARLTKLLTRRFGERALVTAQLPVVVSDNSEPEPDIAILANRSDFYQSAIPRAADAYAVVEVADSSLSLDSGRKLEIYAAADVPEYWIVDVRRSALIVHRGPNGGTYDSVQTFRRGSNVSFAAFPDEMFSVAELIG